jgi:hypothetical protein
LNLAKLLELLVKIDETGPNALIYTSDKLISGNTLFGKYVDLIFLLKAQGLPDAKILLNLSYGDCYVKRTL